jgi:DNA-binding MarR family transcriptional regulator
MMSGQSSTDAIETRLLFLTRWLEASQRKQRYPMDRAGYLLLRRLDSHGPQRVAELAGALGLDGSTVTRQLAVLDDAGHIRRAVHPRDGRATLIEATEAGLRAMAALRRHRQERIGELFGDWSAAEREQLGEVLAHLNTALEQHVLTD